MESPFFGNSWYDYTPRRAHYSSPVMRQVPFQNPYSNRYYSQRDRQVPVQPEPTRPAKIVSIPVQSAALERRRSDLQLRSDAALKIQKAFRGHLVRKSVRKIAGIKREVDEIAERVSKKETAELLRGDAKERLKVVETLMSLLLKLDSVNGVEAGVRELRKAVIKKAIDLQERVEASAANHQTPGGGRESGEHETGLQCSQQNGETGVKEMGSSSSENKKKDELLEKMVKENEKMVGLVTELVNRNEKQTRLLGSLSQRVEQLERALINERLRRKKRRHYVGHREEFF